MTTPPIACTLDPALMSQRHEEIRALGRDGLLAMERGEREATLRFRSDPGIRERVAAIVTAESRCCAFLDFRLEDDLLTIAAPPGGEPAMHELADLFGATDR